MAWVIRIDQSGHYKDMDGNSDEISIQEIALSIVKADMKIKSISEYNVESGVHILHKWYRWWFLVLVSLLNSANNEIVIPIVFVGGGLLDSAFVFINSC